MKKIILSIFLFASLHAMAQVDSSQLTITLTLKQKNIAFMGYQMLTANTIPDSRMRDTLIHYFGSGLNPDSQIVTHFKTGFLIKFIQGLFSPAAGISYSALNELANGTTTPTTYIGLASQIGTKSSTVNSEQGISKYLGVQLAAVLGSGTTIFAGYLSAGTTWLQTPVTYN